MLSLSVNFTYSLSLLLCLSPVATFSHFGSKFNEHLLTYLTMITSEKQQNKGDANIEGFTVLSILEL